MFSKVYSGGLLGVEGYLVQVEADVSEGLPSFSMVGYLGSEVREAEERVRTAARNAGFRLTAKKVTVNLSPANVRKEGTGWDLPVAMAVLAAYGLVPPDSLRGAAFLGELGLDGRVKPVRGVLPMALAMRDAGIRRCFLPEENAGEGRAVDGLEIVTAGSLGQLVELLRDPARICPEPPGTFPGKAEPYEVDFSEVQGQTMVRRATELAVAGQHNILYIGPPGSGKSMIARRIPTIMPALSKEEQMEISRVYSACGMLSPEQPLMQARPFRSPHHTISAYALMGGGLVPRPGEISLASRGVLFLDELPEFQKKTLDMLRQPMEDKRVTISRVHGTYDFPAHFMLAAAMNPCPCGYFPDRERCACTPSQVRRYLARISGPLLDRLDVCVEAAPLTFHEICRTEQAESSAAIRARVEAARQVQARRFAGTGLHFNSQMGNREIRRFCALKPEDETYIRELFGRLGLSARGYHKLLRVARTIADLAGDGEICRVHLQEAAGYRGVEERYWKEIR